MRRKWHRAKPKVQKFFRSNRQILSKEVFLINELGEHIGKMPTSEAIERAKELDLDLVEVNPKSVPPVAKIIDLGQLKYERDKKAHKQKVAQKKIDTKGIRLSVRISDHDADFRLKQAIKFLQKGSKLKIELILKGRERQHPQKASETINDFVKSIEKTEGLEIIKEQDLTKQGGRFSIILINKPS